MKVKKNVTLKKTPLPLPLPLPLRVESGPSDRALTELLSLEPGRKRCPKGTRRDKKTGKCKKTAAAMNATKAATRAKTPDAFTLSPTRKRCPRGYRIDKKTRKCHRVRK